METQTRLKGKDIRIPEDKSNIQKTEMPTIGKLTEFIQEKQAWEDYIEQLELYLDANDITDG